MPDERSAMSDVDDDVVELGRRALRTSRVEPLRQRMRTFIREHHRDVELGELRRKASGGITLSELVDEGRTERQ